jgi:DNA adenine methylase
LPAWDRRVRAAGSLFRGSTEESGEPIAQPFLKWAGGKWAIAPTIASLFPADARERVYREPFLGGGAMFFYLRPARAHLSDSVADLIDTYKIVRKSVEPLIKQLEALRETHSSDQYYAVRERFNLEPKASKLERATWLIYLNKTCFNGLFRTNNKGLFNVPAGRFRDPKIVNPDKIRLASAVLSRAKLTHASFDALLETAEEGDLIYLDPPYVPISRSASFSSYSDGVFTLADQARLAEVYRQLDHRGCKLALSNSDTPAVRQLYDGFDFRPITAPRVISAKGSTRGPIAELLIRNYD